MKKNKRKNNQTLLFLLLGILLFFGVINIVQLYSTQTKVENKINLEIENAKAAQITLTIIDINKTDCPKCLDINKIVKLITDSQKTNITKFLTKNFNDEEIQSKIKELKINKFPALIIEGNINQSSFLVKNLEAITKKVSNNVYVFMPIEAPYLNNEGDLIGKVDLVALYNNECFNCPNVELLFSDIDNTNIYLNEVRKIEINSIEGKNLVSQYKIEKVPTLLFSKEFSEYKSISTNWEKNKIGSIEDDGTYVLRAVNPVYFSIKENKTVGQIKMTILTNANCETCFNESDVYSSIMSKLGILNYETDFLISTSIEAKDLILKYNLKKFPMIILEGDTQVYPNLQQVWDQVGTIEDNKYIFRNVELLQLPYYDLQTGEVSP